MAQPIQIANLGTIPGATNPPPVASSPSAQTPTPTPTSQQPASLDPETVNLAKAIRKVESNDNFSAKGKSGEYGAYQWMPATWAADSQRYLGQTVPFGQATPEEQNEVAYKKIAAWKAAGYNVGQIASMWNAGGENPNAYIEGHSGTNTQGVSYDTASYAKKVATAYQQFKASTPGFNPAPFGSGSVSTPLVAPQNQINPPTRLSEVGTGIASGLGQAGQSAIGALKSIPASINSASQLGQGLMSKLIPGGAPTASLPNAITTPTKSQTPGFVGGLIGQLGIGGESAANTGDTSLIPEGTNGIKGLLKTAANSKALKLLRKGTAIYGALDSLRQGKLTPSNLLEIIQEFL